MTQLSVNINKIATLRNSRGGNAPDLLQVAQDCERFGAQGITVHPRPDERHIRYADVYALKPIVTTEFNIEGNPRIQKFVDMVLEIKPTQVTLVPDGDNQLTSDHGWDTLKYADYLKETIALFKKQGIRTSIFTDADEKMIKGAKETGTDRIELYTESYAHQYKKNPEEAIKPFVLAAEYARHLNIGVNAGHDLSLENLAYFKQHIPFL
jgi:pyridoxine 5-phosphate synthase